MEEASLVLVATPIGNLSDISMRAIEELKNSDLILCEDTRHSQSLLNALEIKKKTISYHEHNEASRTEEIINWIREGKKLALITDAGMPCISDPGSVIVDRIHQEGLKVSAIPGANAVLTAVALSGMDSSRFEFIGFLPRDNKKREIIESTINYPGLSVIYESPMRLLSTLELIKEICPGRRVFIARELTKLYEDLFRGTVEEAIERYREGVKGEIVIVLDSFVQKEEIDLEEKLIELIEGGMSASKASKILARDYKLNKNEIYQLSIKIKEKIKD